MKGILLDLRAFFSILLIGIFWAVSTPAFASEEGGKNEALNVSDIAMHHVMDDHQWAFTHSLVMPLPIIVYSQERGLEVFSSSNFFDEHHQPKEFNGYKLDHNHITLNGQFVHDFSITKNVCMLFIVTAIIVFLLLRTVAGYKKNKGKAPSGIQSFIELIIVFVKDEVVKPNVGPRYERYLPYLLTLFFFILTANLIGLVPGSGNLSGNIAVTSVLALFTFLITNFSGNKNYWSHILWTPGVPLPLRLIILPVEIIGIFTKPFSLMIRLFAAITAGHIVLLSLLSLTFIFHSWGAGIGASIFVMFINLIELLVAGIQAYVFTLFTSLYIGMAIEEHDHH
jgi:F-type H+-transporting ATPase subunit a